MKWKFFSGLSGLMLAHAALATNPIPLYQNDAVLDYIVPGNPPPTISAINFVNNNVFSVNFSTFTFNTEFYEPWNVLNYTNNGLMEVNTGFKFDTQTTSLTNPHRMAGSFYNVGTINVGTFFASPLFYNAAQLVVSATNITNPGEIDVGAGGFVLFTGGDVDLSSGVIGMEGFGSIFQNFPVAIGVNWGSGTDTNSDWSPRTNLTPTHARSALFATHLSPFYINYMSLDGTTPFYNVEVVSTNLNIVRAVFVQDSSPNVSYNVYFSSNTPTALGGGADLVQDTIEWVGSYVDPVTGATATNYLYLDDATAISTNELPVNGIPFSGMPANFTFVSSKTPFDLNTLASPAFPFGYFGVSVVTNFYSYVNAQLVSTTTATNASKTNPSGALTNLPGRISITASGELNLNLASISGANYLTLSATNRFAGSAGAAIVSPYTDISLGVTNGPLNVTNVLQAAMPNWNGTIEAWSGRWFFVTNGVTNDFRVLLVSSHLTATTLAQVLHLNLYSRTNSVVISDLFNVQGTLFIDATNLTLTTNGVGNGATSPQGELNLESGAILWPSSLPNLRNLTNSGAIRIQNLAQFANSWTGVIVTPATPAVAAAGTLSEVVTSGNVAVSNKVTIGTNIYTFVNTLSNKVANQVKIAPTFDGSMSNLIAAINHAAGAGTSYSTNGKANKFVQAGLLTSHGFAVTAKTNGSSGNSIVTTNSAATTNLTWNGHATLSGGANAVPATTNFGTFSIPYDNFINHGLISDLGATISAKYFENGGFFLNNSLGSFNLQSLDVLLTNGLLTAGGDVSITARSLVASNLLLQAGRSLTLRVTNLLTDTGPANGNIWYVGGTNLVGLNLPIKPLAGDLLGTTISCTAPGPNKQVVNTWAGRDYGVSTAGYVNNAAIGVLVLDALGASSTFKFNGAGVSNALYVDELVLLDTATNFNATQVNALNISSNMVIYYADALLGNGASVASKLNHLNGNRLRWVAAYAGYFSSTNIVYPGGITNALNRPLVESITLDSDGDGIPNASDPTPLFTSNQWAVVIVPPTPANTNKALFTWHSIPGATNVLESTTNMFPPYIWVVLTNFISPSLVPPANGWPITNVVSYHFTNVPPVGSLGVWVYPNSTMMFGP